MIGVRNTFNESSVPDKEVNIYTLLSWIEDPNNNPTLFYHVH